MTEYEYIQGNATELHQVGSDRCFLDFHIEFQEVGINPQDTLTDIFDNLIARVSIIEDEINVL